MTVTPFFAPSLMPRVDSLSKPLIAPAAVSCLELEQAEICREQAREAVRLKRFGAASGLFSTAISLCRHALAVDENDENTRDLATERLTQINLELATYAELFKTKK